MWLQYSVTHTANVDTAVAWWACGQINECDVSECVTLPKVAQQSCCGFRSGVYMFWDQGFLAIVAGFFTMCLIWFAGLVTMDRMTRK